MFSMPPSFIEQKQTHTYRNSDTYMLKEVPGKFEFDKCVNINEAKKKLAFERKVT